MPKRKSLSEAFGVDPEPTEVTSSEEQRDDAEERAQEVNESPNQTETTQYGKRADPSYTQISGNIPEMLKRRFKAKVSMQGRDISSTLEELIRRYVEED